MCIASAQCNQISTAQLCHQTRRAVKRNQKEPSTFLSGIGHFLLLVVHMQQAHSILSSTLPALSRVIQLWIFQRLGWLVNC